MSILGMGKRGEVEFNPDNKDHLRAVETFYETGHWPEASPYFRLNNNFVSVPHMIANILADRYLKEKLTN